MRKQPCPFCKKELLVSGDRLCKARKRNRSSGATPWSEGEDGLLKAAGLHRDPREILERIEGKLERSRLAIRHRIRYLRRNPYPEYIGRRQEEPQTAKRNVEIVGERLHGRKLHEIAFDYGISRERVRQICERALMVLGEEEDGRV